MAVFDRLKKAAEEEARSTRDKDHGAKQLVAILNSGNAVCLLCGGYIEPGTGCMVRTDVLHYNYVFVHKSCRRNVSWHLYGNREEVTDADVMRAIRDRERRVNDKPTATPADVPGGVDIEEFRFKKELSSPLDTRSLVREFKPHEEDVVNHPNHYAPNGVDSFMHMKDQMGKEAFDGFLQGNAIKYVQRYKFKGKPTEDLCKAAFYLFHLAFETTDGSRNAVAGVFDRMTTTLDHAFEHYKPEE